MFGDLNLFEYVVVQETALTTAESVVSQLVGNAYVSACVIAIAVVTAVYSDDGPNPYS